jgi:hypothetical protein
MPTRAINVDRLGQETPHSVWSDVCTLIGGTTAPISLTHTGADPESLTAPARKFAALKPQSADAFTRANGATLIITGSDWIDVATLEFPLFSGRLSNVIC